MRIHVDDVRTAVIEQLDSLFPNNKIYGEEIKQGFEEPCFFVKMFPVSQGREVNNRYKRYHSIDIHYFSASDYPNMDMNLTADKLYEHLEYVKLQDGSLMRGTKMNHEIVDGILHFNIDFDIHLKRQRPVQIKMQTLKQEGYPNE